MSAESSITIRAESPDRPDVHALLDALGAYADSGTSLFYEKPLA